MIPVSSPATQPLAAVLASFEPRATIVRAAALQTVPALHANAVRLELMVHLAVSTCRGKQLPTNEDLETWLNDYLGQPSIALLEDPAEDVFVGSIDTSEGNLRLFLGVWESSDYFLQIMLDTLQVPGSPPQYRDLLSPVLALLRLSDTVAERLHFRRWHVEPSSPAGPVRLPPSLSLEDHLLAVTFSDSDLHALGISRDVLTPFVLPAANAAAILGETIGNSSLERTPLLDFGNALVLALPSSISPASRHFLLTESRRLGQSSAFDRALALRQGEQLEHECLRRLKGSVDSIQPPPFQAESISLHAWLLRYDLNKFIHVILLHDRLEWVQEQTLSTPLTYPESIRQALDTYICDAATHTLNRADCVQGMTLLVFGGIGRGLSLPLHLDPPDTWGLSFISLPDLLTLSQDFSTPLDLFLKCLSQKAWVEHEGVRFLIPNGDFNLYSYWHRTNYQLVPRDVSLAPNSVISLGPEFVASTRERIRILADPHLVRIDTHSFARVVRFGIDAHFTSQRRQPIYASISHLEAGTLAGVAETRRGPTWLLAATPQAGDRTRRLAYELWSGFLGMSRSLLNLRSE